MKRFWLIALPSFIILGTIILFTCGPVYAGILGTVTDYIKGEALSYIIGGIIGALGMFGVSYKLWGQAVKELGDCLWDIYKAVQPGSPGGKTITGPEMQEIIREASEIYPAAAAAIAARKRG